MATISGAAIRRLLALVLFTVSILRAATAVSATVTARTSEDGAEVITLNGTITLGDAEKLKTLIAAASNANRPLAPIQLHSLGGAFGESERVADVIKSRGIATLVPNGARCASGCFLIFASGREKFASYGAWIGVHRGAESGADTPRARWANSLMADTMQRLAVPQRIIDRMLATPHNRVAWLSANELQSFGAKMVGEPSQTPLELALPTASSVLDGQTSKTVTWNGLVEAATRLSSQQNGRAGPKVVRRCTPDTRVCTSAVFYINRNDMPGMLETTFSSTGEVAARKICDFNEDQDKFVCADWP
jgi:hypothetical protein